MNTKKKIGLALFIILLIGVSKYVYDMHINHNFETITEGKVYKSGVIPPDEIADYVADYKIKSIIDLRFPGTGDEVNNPEIPVELTAEKEAIAKIKGVNYFNNGSDQIPTQKNLDYFFEIMDNPDNYPVLVHCYHGVGRAEMYSAIYRIEYENWDKNDARLATRTFVKFSSFDNGKPKGEYLKAYKPRKKLTDLKK
jgi:protein tyrosine/serine phosphatase